ncbi:MAG: SMP-30/gluconolactonase/LRE family protein [Chlamydiales bacterium]|nr:SMP-30/gluconolactonase/LRE family protein [Chlamydiales bacterium]
METLNRKTFIEAHNVLGEGPVWDPRSGFLYWVDIIGGFVNQHDARHHLLKEWKTPSMVTHIALCEDPNFLFLTLRDRFAVLDLKTGEITVDRQSRLESERIRFNDGAVDSEGRLWIGTMDVELKKPDGVLYCLAGGLLNKKDEGFVVSNGMAWSPDRNFFYLTESKERSIYRYAYADGEISNRRLFVGLPQEEGSPDGLTVDSEGYVWSAHWDGSRITRYTPDGNVDRVLELPVSRPTNCCFGGSDMKTLFITSASYELSEEEKQAQPEAGNLFSVEAPTKGIPEEFFFLTHYYSKV